MTKIIINRKAEVEELRRLNEKYKDTANKVIEHHRDRETGKMITSIVSKLSDIDYFREPTDIDSYELDLDTLKPRQRALDFYKTQIFRPYPSMFATTTKEDAISLQTFREMNSKNDGTKFAHERYLISLANEDVKKEVKKEQKAKCKAYTMSTYATTKTDSEGAKCMNNVFCLDFDNVTLQQWQPLIDYLWSLKYVFMMSPSFSGNGIYCLLYHDVPSSRFADMLQQISDDMPAGLTKPDPQCKNVSRLRCESDFPQLWREDDYIIEAYTKLTKDFKRYDNIKFNTHEYKHDAQRDVVETEKIMSKIIEKLDTHDFTKTEGDWFIVIRQCCNAQLAGVMIAKSFARKLSQNYATYNDKEFESKWNSTMKQCVKKNEQLNVGWFKKRLKELNIN